MPTYEYLCGQGHPFERYLPISQYASIQTCECGSVGRKIISKPMILVSPDIHYESPIDGKPITSLSARKEDLARSNCVPYDPDIKQHVNEKRKREEDNLYKSMDRTIDREIALMPARKREKLEAEMQGGMNAEPVRLTAPAKPIKVEIEND